MLAYCLLHYTPKLAVTLWHIGSVTFGTAADTLGSVHAPVAISPCKLLSKAVLHACVREAW